MPDLTVEDLADLCEVTLPNLERGRWTDIAQDLQEYTALPEMLRKDRVVFKSGKDIRFKVQTKVGSNARHVGLLAEDKTTISDGMKEAVMPWRHTVNSWGFDAHEIDIQGNIETQIVDILVEQRAMNYMALAVLLEEDWWGCPAASDELTPHGVKYWITKTGMGATGGFNGTVPSGYTTVAGLNPATGHHPKWRNWNQTYTNVSKEDLVRKMREAATYCHFKSPVPQRLIKFGDNRGYYTNYTVVRGFEEMAESQNDNLGNDVASKDGEATFRRRPVQHVFYLDADTTNPVYGINWGTFRTVFLTNWYLKDRPPKPKAGAHNTLEGFTDLTHNWVCYNRRDQFVVATS